MVKTLSGNLDTFSLADLLQWLEMNALTGRVTVRRGSVRRSIDLKQGAIVYVSSSRPQERLGIFLAKRGALPPETVYTLLAENFASGTNLTRLILDGAHLTRECLAEVVESLALQILLDLFHWRGAEFDFDPGVKTEDILRIQLSLRGQALAIHGAKSVDEQARGELGQAEAPVPEDSWERDFDPDALAGTFWELSERIPSDADGGETVRRRWDLFTRFATELRRNLSGAFRLLPVYDDTILLARAAVERDEGPEAIVRLARFDPFLTADILFLANTLRSGADSLLATAEEAARVLGTEALSRLVSFLVAPNATRILAANRLERLFRRSALSTAVAASHLAIPLGLDPEKAYSLALLEPLSAYEPLKLLLGMDFSPGAFRVGVLDTFRPIYGRTLAGKLNLPREYASLFGSSGDVDSKSSTIDQMVFFARLLAPTERIGKDFTSEDPELADRFVALAHGGEVSVEIERDLARLRDTLGL